MACFPRNSSNKPAAGTAATAPGLTSNIICRACQSRVVGASMSTGTTSAEAKGGSRLYFWTRVADWLMNFFTIPAFYRQC